METDDTWNRESVVRELSCQTEESERITGLIVVFRIVVYRSRNHHKASSLRVYELAGNLCDGVRGYFMYVSSLCLY